MEDIPEDAKSPTNERLDEEARASISKDDEQQMVADDGHIVLPDCLWQVCHK